MMTLAPFFHLIVLSLERSTATGFRDCLARILSSQKSQKNTASETECLVSQGGRNLTFNFSVSPRGYVDARKGDEPGESAHGNDSAPKISESQRLTRAPLVRYEGRAFIPFMSPWSPCVRSARVVIPTSCDTSR